MAQLPQPNIANLNTAIAGMAQEGGNIAQSVQQFNNHQQALGTKLGRLGNVQVGQLQQQLQQISAQIRDGFRLSRAE